MLSRKSLEDLFAALPALLVSRAGLTADQATSASDNALLEEWKHDPYQLHVYVSVFSDNQLESYKMTYVTLDKEYQLHYVQKMIAATTDRYARWEHVE